MCSVAAAALVIGAVGALGTAYQQREAQKSNVEYQNKVTDATQANAAKAAASDYIASAERVQQVRQAAAQESFAASRETEKARSTLAVGAAAAGLEGGSVEDIRLALAIKAGDDAAVRATNLTWQETQIARSIEKIQVNAQNRVNTRFLPDIEGVDYAQLLGNLGTATTNYLAAP